MRFAENERGPDMSHEAHEGRRHVSSGSMLLVPSDPLYPRKCDEHFAEEAEAARELGIHVALIDHDALTRSGGAEAAVVRVAPTDPPRDAI